MAENHQRPINRSVRSLRIPALALGTPELVSIPDNEIVEVNDIGQALMKASQIIRESVVEREQGELATQEMGSGQANRRQKPAAPSRSSLHR